MTEYENRLLDSLLTSEATASKLADQMESARRDEKKLRDEIRYLEGRVIELTRQNNDLRAKNSVMRDTIKSYGGKVVVPDEERPPWYKRFLGHVS